METILFEGWLSEDKWDTGYSGHLKIISLETQRSDGTIVGIWNGTLDRENYIKTLKYANDFYDGIFSKLYVGRYSERPEKIRIIQIED